MAATKSDREQDLDDTVNWCGITNMHAFPILDLIKLHNESEPYKVDHMIYMMKDPRGPKSKLNPIFKFSFKDTESWTDHYRK